MIETMRIKIGLLALLLSTFVELDSIAQKIPLFYSVENTGANCAKPNMPSFNELPSIDALPDPFKWADGRGRSTSFKDWSCRRAEISAQPSQEWLADESGYISCKAAQEVWKAFGISDRFGFSIVSDHPHCQLPEIQKPEVIAFVEKFLLGNTNANTNVVTTPYNTDLSPWIKW